MLAEGTAFGGMHASRETTSPIHIGVQRKAEDFDGDGDL